MSKKLKGFIKVFYYLIMFGFGVMFALTLPSGFTYDETMKYVKSSLNSGKYDEAAEIVGGYLNTENRYLQTFEEGGGIVLYEAATVQYPTANEPDAKENMTKSYSGFLFGTKKSYNIKKNGGRAKIVLVDKEAKTHDVSIIDYDTDGDGIKDSCASINKHGFLYLDFNEGLTPNIDEIQLIDCDGNIYQTLDVEMTFDTPFFSDVQSFIDEYNGEKDKERLSEIEKVFLEKNDAYRKCVTGPGPDRALAITITFIIVYFLIIYFIGDTFLGNRYIIHFFKWVLVKVFKVKFKSDDEKRIKELKSQAFGTDYNCSLTIKLNVDEVPEFNEVVVIKYSNEIGSLEFNLIKTENYQQTKSIKAGVYVNPWFEINSKYVFNELPETLLVEGFRKEITIKITRKESEEK